ncbi:MATE family efflux transporter [Vibrio halioticoli]|uniref:MATE family efflux transporter n=1 Tax=Vibrio halioticoli TaxID=71388 RepID=UPI000A0280EF|nr:MATE family efflux transporter [Vibrio halioticoli]
MVLLFAANKYWKPAVHRYQKEAKNLIKLATPILIASIAQTGMGVVDTIMAGGVSATDMAAVAIASSIWLPSILFGIGILMALIPIVAQLNGRGHQHKIANEIQQGASLAVLIGFPIAFVLLQTSAILRLMDVDATMATITTGYMHAMLPAVPAFLFFQTLRSFTDGMSLTKPAMVIGFLGLLINIPLNYIFVYGKLGMPALGGIGCGVATTMVYWIMFSFLLLYTITSKRLAHIGLFKQWHKPKLQAQYRLFKLGLPVALAIFFEVTLFAVVALLISPLGPVMVAAHQIAINVSGMVFMIPMSIGGAVSIRVGHKLGEEDIEGAKIATHVAILLGLALALATAILTVVFRENIADLYTDNRAVTTISVQLLLLAAIYQFSDTVQVVAAGALRGYKDMKSIFNRTFIAYWVIGLPLGYLLGSTNWIVEPMGAHGYWYGFIAGLTVAAVLLASRIRWMHSQAPEVQLKFASQ